MLRTTSLIVGLMLAGLAVGCSNAPAPPPDTRVSDVQAVKDLEAVAVKEANAKDPEKWSEFFCRGCFRPIPRRRHSEWEGNHQSGGRAAFC